MQTQAPNSPKFSFSKGFGNWLATQSASLAFSSYDGGGLFIAGSHGGNPVVTNEKFGRVMGLCVDGSNLYIATNNQILRLRNTLNFGDKANGIHDAVYVPNAAYFIGNCDIHELYLDKTVIHFVNTRYSCLAHWSSKANFMKVWAPSFITATVPEDRCHLNGACGEGYVTAIGQCDALEGWRSHRQNGGVVLKGKDVIYDNLSMPHSPRQYKNALYFLDSGRGYLRKGAENHTFLNGFARGLSFNNDYAVITISLPRDGIFHGLELQRELAIRNAEAWCGVLIVDLNNGGVVEWLRIEGATKELFDCAVLPYGNPLALAPGNPMLANLTRFD